MKYQSKLWNKAVSNVSNSGSCGLSDMECYSKDELKAMYLNNGWTWGSEQEVRYANGSYSIEWDGVYGKHWESFACEGDLNKALSEYKARYDKEVHDEYARLVEERSKRIKFREESRNTLGNLFPELSKLM